MLIAFIKARIRNILTKFPEEPKNGQKRAWNGKIGLKIDKNGHFEHQKVILMPLNPDFEPILIENDPEIVITFDFNEMSQLSACLPS